jgi:plasmid stabilization system protein ParE
MGNWGPIIAAVVAAVGWYANHRLSVRAQKKNFQNQLLDRARMEIARSIHAYQRWLSELAALYEKFPGTTTEEEPAVIRRWRAKHKRLHELAIKSEPTSDWIAVLAEYEILFPETRTLRGALTSRQQGIQGALGETSRLIRDQIIGAAAGRGLGELQAHAANQRRIIGSQLALTTQLRVHLQNVSLSAVFDGKREVPAPVLAEGDNEVIALGQDGQLTIIQGAVGFALPRTTTKARVT